MGLTAEQAVNALIAGFEARDLDAVMTVCADDIEYDNVPMGKMLGAEQMRAGIGPMLAGAEAVEWIVHRQIATDTMVMNERLDKFLLGGNWLEIPVMGVFEVTDGRITLWRDYFDLETWRRQSAPAASSE